MNKKKKPIKNVKTKGKQSPAIYTENGNVSINYGSSDSPEQSNLQGQSPKKSKWLRNLVLLATIVGIFGGIAEFSGYSIKGLLEEWEIIDKPDKISLPSQEVKTEGENSPAVIVKDGNATINYGESSQKKDSTSQK